MIFLTEEDIRSRAPQAGGVLSLGQAERLTPSAAEYASQLRLRIEHGGAGVPGCKPCEAASVTASGAARPGTVAPAKVAPQAGSPASSARTGASTAQPGCSQELTHLDKDSVVGKNHPSIVMRGKLDSLLALAVLAQTQFDPKNRLPGLLKQALADLNGWIMQTLASEVGGTAFTPKGMAGMDTDVLHQISREPKKYLGVDHFAADASMGGNVALLNWLRSQVREAEVTAVACSANMDVVCSLNRLSSAVYVLMLLTLAAERGIEIGKPGA
ncbi:cobalamin adenosyltransferase [Desulfovibrio sp. OttesenSCG-928-C06]|nr:cobalamin adenosyltransferase [Desulfovibrio sp. OttesenSCG-928-C06]